MNMMGGLHALNTSTIRIALALISVEPGFTLFPPPLLSPCKALSLLQDARTVKPSSKTSMFLCTRMARTRISLLIPLLLLYCGGLVAQDDLADYPIKEEQCENFGWVLPRLLAARVFLRHSRHKLRPPSPVL